MDNLKTCVWDALFDRHFEGMVVVVAHSKEEALALICVKDQYSYGVIKDVDPIIVDSPMVFIDRGGD